MVYIVKEFAICCIFSRYHLTTFNANYPAKALMKRFEFVIEWYHKENERNNSLHDSLNIPIGILSAISAIMYFLLTQFTFKPYTSICFCFIALVVIVAGLWIEILIRLSLAYNNLFKGYTYEYLPLPSDLNQQYQALENYVSTNSATLDPSITADLLYEEQLYDMVSGYLDININNNDRKSMNLFKARRSILICIFFVILSFFPFGFNYIKYNQNNKVQEVVIKNIADLTKVKEVNSINQSHMSNSNQRPTPPPPPPPRSIKEGHMPTANKGVIRERAGTASIDRATKQGTNKQNHR